MEEKLVMQFLYAFARFEYALKRSGYQGQEGKAAEAEWDRFENTLTGMPAAELAPVLKCGDYILSKPPRKQVATGGGLSWVESAPTASPIKTLIIYVRRIRNNLFHGGKFPEGPVYDVARDAELLSSGVAVLKALLELANLPAGIKHYYQEEV